MANQWLEQFIQLDNLTKAARLNLDPNSPTGTKEWKYLYRSFLKFIDECVDKVADTFTTPTNYVLLNKSVLDRGDYDSAIGVLEQLFVKTPNEKETKLNDTLPYLDNITLAGREDQQEYDKNVMKFHEAIQRRNLSFKQASSLSPSHLPNTRLLCWKWYYYFQ